MVKLKECKKPKNAKKTAKATVEGQGKRETTQKWRDEDEDNLNIMGIKKGRQWSETIGNGGRFYWKPRVTKDCSA
jgi:hypothetical protein